MKATDFDFRTQLQFDFDAGITSFMDSRLVVFDANAIGLLRHQMIQTFGPEQARSFFLSLGYNNGYSDFMQMKTYFDLDSEMDLLASGPVIHTWEGIVNATPSEIRFDRETGEFFFTGVWTNSYEAEQHLFYNEPGSDPVCWSLMGYATGWCTAFFKSPLIAIEPHCMGKGDEACGWKIQPPGVWRDEIGDAALESYLAAYPFHSH